MTDGGGGTVDFTAINILVRTSNSPTGALVTSKVAAGSTAAMTDGKVSFIGVRYNAGSPAVFVIEDTETWNLHDEFPIGSVVREGATLHIQNNASEAANAAVHIQRRFHETEPFARDERGGGLVLGNTGTRNPTMTAGAMFDRDTRFPVGSIDTSGADTFDIYFRDGVGGFTVDSGRTTWPNTAYDNDAGSPTTLTNNRYAVIWFYAEPDGELVAQYGRAQYVTSGQAEEEDEPDTAPIRIVNHARIIGRVVFKESVDAPVAVETVFVTSLSSTGVTDHADLANLGADDHSQYSLVDGTRAFTGAVTIGADTDGHDFKAFGNTTGKYFEWDESLDGVRVEGTVAIGGIPTATLGLWVTGTTYSAGGILLQAMAMTALTGISDQSVATGTSYVSINAAPTSASAVLFEYSGGKYLPLYNGTGSITTALSGIHVQPTLVGNATSVPKLVGVYIRTVATTGTITDQYGVYYSPIAQAGTVTNHYGLKTDAITVGTNRFGLDLGNVSGGSTNFAIRTALGLNQFGDFMEIDQPSASGAVPVLKLDQGDIDDSFIDFVGTSQTDGTRSISSSSATAGAKDGAIRVDINGTLHWLRLYDSAV